MNSENPVKPFLNVKFELPLSDNKENPSFIDSLESIKLIFSEDVDMNTVSDGIKIYNVKSNSGEFEVDIVMDKQGNSQNIFRFSGQGIKLGSGEEYKLSINSKLKSTDGKSLENDLNKYFTLDYDLNLNLESVDSSDTDRSWIVCISDIHLGADDTYSEITRNRDALVKFLNWVRLSPNIKELVIAGDLIDEWFVPMDRDTFKGKTQLDFVKAVALNNKPVIDAFNEIIKEGLIKLTYVPGNHDILISSDDIEAILPGISQARDVRGLGAYSPDNFPGIRIEHGHRYNFFCAPDFSNRTVTKSDSILPSGYFFTRMATSSVVQGRKKREVKIPSVTENDQGEEQFLYYLYFKVWEGLIKNFPVNEGIENPVINTGIDGFTDFYAINDFLPFQNPEDGHIDVNLYKGIIESWDERQDNNLVPVKIPTKDAILKAILSSHLDEQSAHQFFNNPNSNERIVIFGHSHDARIIESYDEKQDKNVYINSGTWIDSKDLSMTFVVIMPQMDENSIPSYVGLYQYSDEGNIKKLDSQIITNLRS